MPEFVITTWERVEGTYLVTAEDEHAARAKFDHFLLIDFDGVNQINYMAFEVDVREVQPA